MKSYAEQGRNRVVAKTDVKADRKTEFEPIFHGFIGVAEHLFPQLHALNFEFLKLAASDESCLYGGSRWGLASSVTGLLSGLADSELQRISECPSALFDLSFDDVHRWEQSCCELVDARVDAHEEPRRLTVSARVDRFVASVFFLLWHSIELDPTFARFAFGLREATAVRLQRLSVTQVVRMAPMTVNWLQARWSNNPHFWPNLLRSAEGDSPIHLQIAKLMGCQLMAAMHPIPVGVVRLGHVSMARK